MAYLDDPVTLWAAVALGLIAFAVLDGLALGVIVRLGVGEPRPAMREAWGASAAGLFAFALASTGLFLTSRLGDDFVRLLWMAQIALGDGGNLRSLSEVPGFGYLTSPEAMAAASDPLGAFWRFFRQTMPAGLLGSAVIFMMLGGARGFWGFIRIAAATIPFAALGWAALIWLAFGLLRFVPA